MNYFGFEPQDMYSGMVNPTEEQLWYIIGSLINRCNNEVVQMSNEVKSTLNQIEKADKFREFSKGTYPGKVSIYEYTLNQN